ncbi:MAG: inositol-3-phosphate synthase [Candidatus Hydrothermarchaeota archaeon]
MDLWLIGAYGAVSTTTMVGAKGIERGIAPKTGLVTELAQFSNVKKIPLKFRFGGHEIRNLGFNAYEASLMHWNQNRHYDMEILEEVKEDLSEVRAKKGTALNCGQGIKALGETCGLEDDYSLREIVDILSSDMKKFKKKDTVIINIASTEPPLEIDPEYHIRTDDFERLLDEDKKEKIRASALYAYSALKNGIPYANFTPSVGSSLPALKKLALENKVPHAGNDGKTGETLVKTTLVPMFLYRNLDILGWMSFNILGDDDGKVLDHQDNKTSKIITKDSVLEAILGYSPHSICEISLFPSLVDNKIAFDFVHFKGFLGTKMKFQFVWDGIDCILAAPLIIDIARLLLYAKRRGEYGVIKEMGFFFKDPMDSKKVNTHEQFMELVEWVNSSKKTNLKYEEPLEYVYGDLG